MWLSCRNWIYHCDCATSVLIPLSLILQMAFLHFQSFHRLFPTYLAVCTKQDQSSCLQSAHNAGLHHLLITFSITHFCSFLSGNPSLLEESHHQPPPSSAKISLGVRTFYPVAWWWWLGLWKVHATVIILISQFPCNFSSFCTFLSPLAFGWWPRWGQGGLSTLCDGGVKLATIISEEFGTMKNIHIHSFNSINLVQTRLQKSATYLATFCCPMW